MPANLPLTLSKFKVDRAFMTRYIIWHFNHFEELPQFHKLLKSKYIGRASHLKMIEYIYNYFDGNILNILDYLNFVYDAWLNKEDASIELFLTWAISPKMLDKFKVINKKKQLAAKRVKATAGKATYSEHKLDNDYEAEHHTLF